MTVKMEKIGGISSAAVEAKTGKGWQRWLSELDRAGCRRKDHKEIVAVVSREVASPWWRQMVAVGYEQARGLRQKHQKNDGFSISVSKTVDVSAAQVFAAFKEARRRASWLGVSGLRLRGASPSERLRFTWGDGLSVVEVSVTPKSRVKSQVVVQHHKLSNAAAAEEQKREWRDRLNRLNSALVN